MRLIGISMVKNEADIIESFVRHNLKFLDCIFIIDNGSADGTREILSRLMYEEKLPLAVYDDPEMGYFQSEKTTRLSFYIDFYFKPDFIFPLDADEFIKVTSREVLESYLALLPEKTAGRVQWQTYVFTNETSSPGIQLFENIKYRRIKENPQYHKVIIPKGFSSDPNNKIAQGNHYLANAAHQIPHQLISDFFIAHFPVRSERQLKLKILLGWLAYIAKNPKKNEGYHWKQIFDLILQGKFDQDSVSKISKNYAQDANIMTEFTMDELVEDPLQTDTPLRYQCNSDIDESIVIIKTIEKSFHNNDLLPPIKIRNLSIDWPPFGYIQEKYKPETVLDIGCNNGEYVKLFEIFGARYSLGVGTRPYDDEILCNSQSYFYYDCLDKLNTDNKIDLIICTEQLHSMEKDTRNKVIEFMTQSAKKKIIITCGTQNQPGVNYLNNFNPEYWIDTFHSHDWEINIFDSQVCRSMSSCLGFKRHLLVFDKIEDIKLPSIFLPKDLSNTIPTYSSLSHTGPGFFRYPLSQPL